MSSCEYFLGQSLGQIWTSSLPPPVSHKLHKREARCAAPGRPCRICCMPALPPPHPCVPEAYKCLQAVVMPSTDMPCSVGCVGVCSSTDPCVGTILCRMLDEPACACSVHVCDGCEGWCMSCRCAHHEEFLDKCAHRRQ